jgi:hypothetical protein
MPHTRMGKVGKMDERGKASRMGKISKIVGMGDCLSWSCQLRSGMVHSQRVSQSVGLSLKFRVDFGR